MSEEPRKSDDREKAWLSINHSILSGLQDYLHFFQFYSLNVNTSIRRVLRLISEAVGRALLLGGTSLPHQGVLRTDLQTRPEN